MAATSASSRASRSTALPGKTLIVREEILEPGELRAGADADQHVADVEGRVRLERRIERSVGLAYGDDDSTRLRAELARHALAHPAEAADDEVVPQVVDRP